MMSKCKELQQDNNKESFILLITCSSTVSAEAVIQDIIGIVKLPEPRHIIEKIYAYPWVIENKYYTAHVQICSMVERTIGNEQFADAVQAVILHFDASSHNSFGEVKRWNDYWVHWCPEIKLLVCDRCIDDDAHELSRKNILSWCIENEFELIEYQDPEFDDNEDDTLDTKLEAIKRIRSALNAHTWPNLVMKNENTETTGKPAPDTELADTFGAMSLARLNETECTKTKENIVKMRDNMSGHIDSLLSDDEMRLFQEIGKEDPGGESFEALFHKMKDMKEKASTITNDDERKAYAEKVAIMFWKAMGGDDEEIDGLDSD